MNNGLKKILEEYLANGRIEAGTNRFLSSKSGKICTQRVNRVLGQVVRSIGLKKKVTCHILRHSFASNILEKGANILQVQKLLGHESIRTTAIYLHTTFEELQEAVNTL